MGSVIVMDGKDPLTKPVLDYLKRAYGIPAGHVQAIQLHSGVGQVMTVEVTLVIDKDILHG